SSARTPPATSASTTSPIRDGSAIRMMATTPALSRPARTDSGEWDIGESYMRGRHRLTADVLAAASARPRGARTQRSEAAGVAGALRTRRQFREKRWGWGPSAMKMRSSILLDWRKRRERKERVRLVGSGGGGGRRN